MARTLALALLLALAGAGCRTAGYLGEQGIGQLRLLQARRRIPDVLRDPSVSDDTKRRLALATEARQFGIDTLGLTPGPAFTRYLELNGEPIAWDVEAAEPDHLRSYHWVFPLVGALPYLGYFHEAGAQREAARLAALGYDVYVRAVAGYSTLGITADPVYSSMIEGSDARIVEVVLHEMTHATVFIASQAEWNESVATFVGLEGAAAFFAARGAGDQIAVLRADADRRQADEASFSAFISALTTSLRALYEGPGTRADKLRLREAIFAAARAHYLARFPPRPGRRPGVFATEKLNNALVMSFANYHGTTPEHRALYARLAADLPRFVALYKRAVRGERDPVGYLRRLGRGELVVPKRAPDPTPPEPDAWPR